MIPFRISPARLWLAILFLAVPGSFGAEGQVLEEVAPKEISVWPVDSVGVALSARVAEGPFVDASDPALEPIIDEISGWPALRVKSTGGDAVHFSEIKSIDEVGRLVEIEGIIRQVSNLQGSGKGPLPLQEWAIEMTDGSIAIVVTTVESSGLTVGRRVGFLGRYSGSIETRSRDGQIRSWPLVIGRVRHLSDDGGWIGLPFFVLLLGGTVLFLRRRAATARHSSPIIREGRSGSEDGGTGVEVVAEPMSLPTDPADALEALAGQADAAPRSTPAKDAG